MDALTKLYWWSTDPDTKYIDLVSPLVGASILLHATAYAAIATLFMPTTSCFTLFPTLCLIMAIGYIMRLQRAKSFYSVYMSKEKTRESIDKAYLVWYFLA